MASSEAAKKAWETRRANAAKKTELTEKQKLSQRALKAHETMRARGINLSDVAKKAWETRRANAAATTTNNNVVVLNKAELSQKEKLSQRALKAWETRRANTAF